MSALFSTLTKQVPDTLEHADRWREQAACADPVFDPETWFPIGEGPRAQQQAEDAKRICYRCPVIDVCLRWAMESGQDTGVWGGLDEKERYNLRRRQTRATGTQKKRTTIPQYNTFTAAYDELALAVDGHIEWTGPNEVKIDGARKSPNQVAWRATRDRAPVGPVLIDCDHDGCVQHLTDQTIRDNRARQVAQELDPGKCGTVPGYKVHRRRGEEACDRCLAAKAIDSRSRRAACGTRSGYQGHRRRNEETCVPCRQANADADRRLRNTGTTKPLAA